ncbi:MAG: DUF3037 domain-containing protein [Chloroflexota bacterium]
MAEPAGQPFQYAVVRVTPRVERGERVNVGVVLLCRAHAYLGIRVGLGPRALAALAALEPELDLELLRAHLEGLRRVVEGDPAAGPVAALAPAERFHWAVSPSSTMIDASDQHTGLTRDAAATLEHLARTLAG